MPIIDVACPQCGKIETLESVAWCLKHPFGKPCECPECGAIAERVFERGINEDCGENIRYSKALGMHPDMIESGEAFKIHPGANFRKTDGGMYELEIKGRGEKLRRIKERSLYLGQNLHEAD